MFLYMVAVQMMNWWLESTSTGREKKRLLELRSIFALSIGGEVCILYFPRFPVSVDLDIKSDQRIRIRWHVCHQCNCLISIKTHSTALYRLNRILVIAKRKIWGYLEQSSWFSWANLWLIIKEYCTNSVAEWPYSKYHSAAAFTRC